MSVLEILAHEIAAPVGRSADVAVLDGALVIDARARYLIPELWEMHVHTAGATDLRRSTLLSA